MKYAFNFLILVSLFFSCQMNDPGIGGEVIYHMAPTNGGNYSSRSFRDLKKIGRFKQNSFYSIIQISEEGPNNFLFLINTTDSWKSFPCEDGQPRMIQEAKDENGNWKPIEYWPLSTCGNSYYTCSLEPNQFISYKLRKYNGSYRTKLRVKYKIGDKLFYSETFNGKINKEQFIVPEQIREDQLLLN